MASTASIDLTELGPAQLEFLRRRLQNAHRQRSPASARPAIPRRGGQGPWPLSFAQRRLWFLHQVQPRSAAYHIPMVVQFTGALRLASLEGALAWIVDRHEALRTTFHLSQGQPVQRIRSGMGFDLARVDLTALAEPDRRHQSKWLERLEALRPFDLEQGPLLRGIAVKTDTDRHRLHLTLHHIAADNWSVTVLMKEVSIFYNALTAGSAPQLPELPLQYADFTVWQHRWLRGEVLDEQLDFWRRQLAEAPPKLDLPADHPRPATPTFRFGRLAFGLPEELVNAAKALARRQGTTLYNVLLATFNALLYRYTGQDDIVLGSPVMGRHVTELEGLIGFFVNTLLLRNRPRGDRTFEAFLQEVHEASLDAFAHQNLPFERIVEDLRPDRDSTLQPLFQVMFNLYDGVLPEVLFDGVDVEHSEVQIGTWNDLDLLLVDRGDDVDGYLRYNVDLFEAATIHAFAETFQAALAKFVRSPHIVLDELPLGADLAAQATASRARTRRRSIVVSSTFTDEPLGDSLRFWMRQLDIPADVVFAPYDQVFQQLLDPGSLFAENNDGVNVILIRFEDWGRDRRDGGRLADRIPQRLADPSILETIERQADHLLDVLTATRLPAPVFTVLAPTSDVARDVELFQGLCQALDRRFRDRIEELSNVYLVRAKEQEALYPVASMDDAYADQIGHVPFTASGFAALGTLIARKVHALIQPPIKVIVLDCDQTLWQGVCAEDGPLGVVLDPARQELQEFILAQRDRGVLLALASKNREADVWATFDQRPDFPLRRDHLTAWRINWSAKSENLHSLAAELDLGLDSFVFIDDNPVECAEVRAGCPEVLVLQVPTDEVDIPRTLRHFWAFDKLRTTEEDRQRSSLYRQRQEREHYRQTATSYADFLAGLELEIEAGPILADRLPRVAQLTQRTNQFNASGIRRQEHEIRSLLDSGALDGHAVKVRDRFGDYGLVGVVLFAPRESALEVDTFLLSCRVLGRGVEHHLLAELGAEAKRRGLARVDVMAVPSARNQPIFDFLRKVGGAFEIPESTRSIFAIPTPVAAATALKAPEDPVTGTADRAEGKAAKTRGTVAPPRSQHLDRIARELFDVAEIERRIADASRPDAKAEAVTDTPPRNPTESRVARIFVELLGLERVGIHDSFFGLGGHSLLGTMLLSRLHAAFDVELPVLQLFQTPTVAGLAELLDEQLKTAEERSPTPTPIVAGPRDGALPLSFAQRGMWFVCHLQPDNPFFNLPTTVSLTGDLSVTALAASWNEVLRRHEALRTRFRLQGGDSVQVVDPFVPRTFPIVDLSSLSVQDRQTEGRQLAHEEGRRTFALDRDPLLRFTLLRLAPRHHLGLMTVHHIAADRWSLGLLTQEIGTAYHAFVDGHRPSLPTLPIQYPDFALWQHHWLQGEVLEQELEFWKAQVQGAPDLLTLPLDRPRRATRRYRGGRRFFQWPAQPTDALRALAHGTDATLFMVLMTGWQTLLARLAHQTDVTVGTLIANRHRSEVENLIGFFANTLPLRTQLAREWTWNQCLARVRKTALEIYAHQDLPFEKLVEELNLARNPSLTPVFQVAFILQNTPETVLTLKDLRLAARETQRDAIHYDLLFMIEEADGGLRGTLDYDRDLFDTTTLRRMLRQFKSVLTAMAENPDGAWQTVPLLSPAQQQLLRFEWTDTRRPMAMAGVADTDRSVYDLFRDQAQRRPTATAVTCGDARLTYRELHRRAELAAASLAPDVTRDLAAILADRSFDFLTTTLALYRLGSAYLPLDPAHPNRRIRQILEGASIQLLLVAERYRDRVDAILARIPTDRRPRVRTLDKLTQTTGRRSQATVPVFRSHPHDLGYALFTSGSTGTPKGVMVTQRGLTNHLESKLEYYAPNTDDIIAQTASQCFDISTWQFFGPLIVGATVRIVPDAIAHDPLALFREVKDEGITFLQLVPSLLGAMLDEIELLGEAPPPLPRLRWVISTGETLPPALAKRWLKHYPGVPLLNAYGPSECADHVIQYQLRKPSEIGASTVPLGRPAQNLRIHLLDPRGYRVPIAVVGEIVIGGAGPGRGYRGDPRQTAAAFMPDAVGDEVGERLYRSGDLGRFRAGGLIEYLGRVDRQVKVHGFRIEIGEIEAVLGHHAEVGKVAVRTRSDDGDPSSTRLVAYVTASATGPAAGLSDAEKSTWTTKLRDHLLRKLPHYMVPAVFVVLERMPLNANGKIDVRALPAVTTVRQQSTAPRTLTEKAVATIWQEVLGIESAGLEDSFFSLGGHSLLATRVLTRLSATLQVELSLRELFEASSLEELAADLDRKSEQAYPLAEILFRRATEEEQGTLSYAQERLWFLNQLSHGSAAYNLPNALRIRGQLHLPAFARSLNEIVHRHDALRTIFTDVDGQPQQRILGRQPIALPIVDLGALTSEVAEAEILRLARDDARQPFDLSRGPLLRVTLVARQPEEHVLLIAMHHIVSDGWSTGVFLEEFAALYPAFAADLPSPLPRLRFQYPDYGFWQRQILRSELYDRQLAYWREQLADPPPALDLPLRNATATAESGRGATHWFRVEPALADALQRLSQQQDTTLFMTLFGAFGTLLGRLGGTDDLMVGVPVAGRGHPQLEPMIGFFVNTLVLRVDLTARPTGVELLNRVRATSLDAFSHQEMPFEKLVAELNPDRDLNRSALFQVMFALQNTPTGAIQLPGLELSRLRIDTGTSRFELYLELTEVEDALQGMIQYSHELIEPSVIHRMSRQLCVLLDGMATTPGAAVHDLPLLTAAEHQQLLVEWNDPPQPFTSTLLELFTQQVAQTPEAPAVCHGQSLLTYRGLDRHSDHLARALRARDLGAEELVGILLERSIEMPVAMLAVAKAGGAYLPLDPTHPRQRLAYVIEDAAPRWVISRSSLAPLLPKNVSILDLDAEAPDAEFPPGASPPEIRPDPARLAYVIYTSGSTGQPKGVGISHASLANFLLAMRERPGLTARDVLVAVTTLSFDIAALELFLPLIVGARVVIVSREVAADGSSLAAALERRRATVMQATPVTWRLLLAFDWRGGRNFSAFCGGEAIPQELVSRLSPRVQALWNLYGPTETTVWSTVQRLEASEAVKVGRPIAKTRTHVADRSLMPLPVRAPGELVIGGQGLARGYLSRPALTASRFIPDPFGTDAGSRLYRTGDLARLDPDGVLDVLGRNDSQVKIRGFRIELREIESVLAELPAIAQAVVVTRGPAGEQRLISYVVPEPESTPSAADLRSALRDVLPDYMIPSSFAFLEALPLTANGKVDRKALPDASDPAAEGGSATPRSPVQAAIAGLWAEVLGREHLGVDDNLFDLGAHSLLATQAKARIDRTFDVQLPLRRLFELPTVALQAAEVESLSHQASDGHQIPPIVPAPRYGDLPLSFSQQRLWFFDRWEPGNAVFNLPTSVALEGDLSVPALSASVNEIVRRHDALRTRFPDVDGRPVQIVDPFIARAIPTVDLSALDSGTCRRERDRLVRSEGRRPFLLDRDPLLRVVLLRLEPQRHLALVNVHHIAADRWSLGVLTQQIGVAYAAFVQGRRPPLPELPIQYVDYAIWQRQWLQGEILERELAFWKSQVDGAPDTLDLPLDRPRGSLQRYRGGRRSFVFPTASTQRLHDLASQTQATPFMILMTAWQVLLGRLANQSDVVVGTLIANRQRPEVEHLTGFFVNALAVRTELAKATTLKQVSRRVRQTTLEIYGHQDLPFEKLVEELNPERQLTVAPLFQVLLILQNTPQTTLELEGLQFTVRETEREAVNYDLMLTLEETNKTLVGTLDYDRDLFDATTIQRWLHQYQALLETLIDQPEHPWRTVPLLEPAQRQQVSIEWNDRSQIYPHDSTGIELFTAQTMKTPDAVAALFEDGSLTYRALDRQIHVAAEQLRGPQDHQQPVIALLGDRDLNFLIAILAIWKAGAVYLPLDPNHPAERHQQVLEDARPNRIVVARRLAQPVEALAETLPGPRPPITRLEDLTIETLPSSPHDEATREAIDGPGPNQLAYLIFTSGSTGRPKGVMIEHRGMVNHLVAKIRDLAIVDTDTVAQNASQCFDISIWQFVAALLVGGQVRIFPDDVAHDPRRLQAETETRRVSILETVPSMLRAMLSQPPASDAGPPTHVDLTHAAPPTRPGLLAQLRWLVPTGEALAPDLCHAWGQAYPAVPMINAYGPTECSDDVTHHEIFAGSLSEDETVPVGRPVINTRIHILNRLLTPVPIGAAGQLWVGGDGVGRGYWNASARTAETFIPDGFGEAPGRRLYRTGDLGRLRREGAIDFLGRLDFQVKIRGYRIELGEVETALHRHPGVDSAVATATTLESGIQRLVAYVATADASETLDSAELRDFLKPRLPEYMIPSAFVVLAALPLTANGKVDRKALPDIEGDDLGECPYVAPRDELEETVLAVFAEVLEREKIGVLDDFFELGGHSLLATQVTWRLRESFGVDLALRTLFEAPTVAELATVIDERMIAQIEELGEDELDAMLVDPPTGDPVDSHLEF